MIFNLFKANNINNKFCLFSWREGLLHPYFPHPLRCCLYLGVSYSCNVGIGIKYKYGKNSFTNIWVPNKIITGYIVNNVFNVLLNLKNLFNIRLDFTQIYSCNCTYIFIQNHIVFWNMLYHIVHGAKLLNITNLVTVRFTKLLQYQIIQFVC